MKNQPKDVMCMNIMMRYGTTVYDEQVMAT